MHWLPTKNNQPSISTMLTGLELKGDVCFVALLSKTPPACHFSMYPPCSYSPPFSMHSCSHISSHHLFIPPQLCQVVSCPSTLFSAFSKGFLVLLRTAPCSCSPLPRAFWPNFGQPDPPPPPPPPPSGTAAFPRWTLPTDSAAPSLRTEAATATIKIVWVFAVSQPQP